MSSPVAGVRQHSFPLPLCTYGSTGINFFSHFVSVLCCCKQEMKFASTQIRIVRTTTDVAFIGSIGCLASQKMPTAEVPAPSE